LKLAHHVPGVVSSFDVQGWSCRVGCDVGWLVVQGRELPALPDAWLALYMLMLMLALLPLC
jgi:hypothetical protein